MSNFIFLTVMGLLAVVVIVPILNWLVDNSGELDDDEEQRLTENQQ